MRKLIALTLAVAGLGAATAAPALAVDGTTTVSFTVVDGTLAIVPTPAATAVSTSLIGTARVADIILGATTITDTRTSSTGWTYSATTSDYTSTAVGATAIPKTAASFWIPDAPVRALGTQTIGTRVSSPTAVNTSGGSGTLLTSTGTGVNDAVFTPRLRVTIPSSSALALFTGTVTQSVV